MATWHEISFFRGFFRGFPGAATPAAPTSRNSIYGADYFPFVIACNNNNNNKWGSATTATTAIIRWPRWPRQGSHGLPRVTQHHVIIRWILNWEMIQKQMNSGGIGVSKAKPRDLQVTRWPHFLKRGKWPHGSPPMQQGQISFIKESILQRCNAALCRCQPYYY